MTCPAPDRSLRIHSPAQPPRGAPAGRRPRAQGIALPAMVFLIVIFSLMIVTGLSILTRSQHGQILQLVAARASAAARSGTEWGIYQVSDPLGALNLGPSTLPPCFANQILSFPSPLSGLSVAVSCSREPATDSVDEGGLKLVSYRILAVVESGTPGANDYVKRQTEARYTACKNPGGTAPRYSC